MEIYLKLFEVLFPVFFIVGIGYYLGKKNPNFDTSFITTVLLVILEHQLWLFLLLLQVYLLIFSEYFLFIILLTLFGFIVGLIFILLMN